MNSISKWFSAARLRTLPLSISGIIMGSAIAFYQGNWDSIIFSLAIICTLLFQILSNFANDYGDGLKGTDNEQRVGPKRAIQSGAIQKSEMKRMIIIFSILSFLVASSLIYFGALNMGVEAIIIYGFLAILCIIAAIAYTVGKRAYGYHGLGDLMVFIFFGIVSVIGVYVLFTNTFEPLIILPATTIGLLSTAVLNLNNMRDYSNDKRSNKNTLVVKMGPNIAKFYHSILIIASLGFFLSFLTLFENKGVFISLLPFAYLLYHMRKVLAIKQAKDFDPELKFVALSTFFISILFFLSVILMG